METLSDFLVKPAFEHCLSEDDLDFARSSQVENGIPVVFLADGRAVDIVTGQTQSKNIPPAERICYFNFQMDTSILIAKATQTTPVFVAQSH